MSARPTSLALAAVYLRQANPGLEREARRMIEPQARTLLDQIAAAKGPKFEDVGPEAARRMHAALVRMLTGPKTPVASVRELAIPGKGGPIPVRVYHPQAGETLPVLLYFHGGGNVVGDLEMVDEVCRRLAVETPCAVISVDYRLAPEHPYPAALEDAYAALEWLHERGSDVGADPARIAVAGDSAGGTISALLSRYARDRGGPKLVFAALIYAAGDLDFERPSMKAFAEGYLLTVSTVKWFRAQYFQAPPPEFDEYAWPLSAASLAGLPPTLIITAGFDPLQDSANAYGARLAEDGVDVRSVHYPGMVHGFFTYPNYFDRAREAIGEVASSLRVAFGLQNSLKT